MKTIGYTSGEICNRDNCDGIIENHGKDGSCSCHINPPCDYCVTSDEYCPKCGWDGAEEQKESTSIPQNDTWWQEQCKKQEESQNALYAKMRGEIPVTEFEYMNESHTHFSMIKKGVYPDGMTEAEVYQKVKGTFGGRFTRFGRNVFEFIAYTD